MAVIMEFYEGTVFFSLVCHECAGGDESYTRVSYTERVRGIYLGPGIACPACGISFRDMDMTIVFTRFGVRRTYVWAEEGCESPERGHARRGTT